MKGQESHFVKGVPRSFVRSTVARLGMATVLVLAVGLALWSFFLRLRPVIREFQEKTTLMTDLGNEVQQLQLNWDTLDANRTDEKFVAARKQLFAGPADTERWQTDVKNQTLGLAWETRIQMGAARPLPQTNQQLAVLPATLSLQPSAAARQTNSPYNRLLLFLRDLARADKRIDLVELSANGSSNSVEQARAVVHLWSYEGKAP